MKPLADRGRRRNRRRRWCVLGLGLLFGVLVSGCELFEVDAPITLRADRRLEVVSPSDRDLLSLPVSVSWTVEDFDLSAGNQFGVFLDRNPIAPRDRLKWRRCSEYEERPIQAGEVRSPCEDDIEHVFLTTETSITFECLLPQFDRSDRTKNDHRVTVILLDADGNRVGEAVDRVEFEVEENNTLRACRGLSPE